MIPKVSVIIPTYCEAPNLPLLVYGISNSLRTNNVSDYEIIVVDDNSPDRTDKVCQELEIKYASFKYFIRNNERGLATAIKRGIKESDGDIIVTMDADLSHDPSIIPLLIKKLVSEKKDIVIASRFIESKQMQSTAHRILGSKILNLFIRYLLQIPVKDVTGGFFAIRKNRLNILDLDSIFQGYGDYSFALLYRGKQKGLNSSEISFTYEYRKHGTSKTSFFKVGFSYGIRALKLKLNLD